MNVTVHFHGHLRGIMGTRQLELALPEASTLRRLIEDLGQRFGERAMQALSPSPKGDFVLLILINGQDQHFLGGLDTVLGDKDTVDFMPPMSGGEARLGT